IYYFVVNGASLRTDDSTSAWVQDWLACIYDRAPNGRVECSHVATAALPDERLTEIVLHLSYIGYGILPLLCFGTCVPLFRDFFKNCFPKAYELFEKRWGKTTITGNDCRSSQRRAMGSEESIAMNAIKASKSVLIPMVGNEKSAVAGPSS
ncbi:hypothetical protein HK102_002237, partial [Quaeritorhiza haematococci]